MTFATRAAETVQTEGDQAGRTDSAPFWSISATDLLDALKTTPQGLSEAEAQARLERFGPNLLKPKKRTEPLTLLLDQFKSPIILILLFAAVLSFFLEDAVDAIIILVIVLISGLLGFWQERGAADAVEKLLAMVQVRARALRDGNPKDVLSQDIVPGDIVQLTCGASIPGDCRILESKDCFVDEAALTGETYPVEKSPGTVPPGTPLSQRTNALFMGTHIVSGTATALVVRTGTGTEFGQVSERLRLRPPETEFEHGVRYFGYLLMEITLLLVIAIFAINVFLNKQILDSFLFSLALAVGLTPQLLPAIISINLAQGAQRMAASKVIVKRLESIENFGSMNVLCSDKTGTLTEGMVEVNAALNVDGQPCDKVLQVAYLNAAFESGFVNPIDEAIRTHHPFDLTGYQKLDEVPYDFIRKRLSILVARDGTHLMVTKGALQNILDACTHVETTDGSIADLATVRDQLQQRLTEFSNHGFRTLGVAYRDLGSQTRIGRDDETGMTFLGFLTLFDPPKAGIIDTLGQLKRMGVTLRIITGDNRLVAANVGQQMGLPNPHVLTGPELRTISSEALIQQVSQTDIFAEVEPNQKERIITALRKAGNVVGYMGDGINDASALHAADVSISVNSAVDVAKEAADIVLLEKDLGILVQGVREGRITFANTLKYVFMATSANFGNMFSMAGASLFLPFLPLLPKQILLTNLLTDFPEITIASDSVDGDLVDRPRRWDIRFIRNFMLVFGPLSSVFDYLTFGTLLFVLRATPELFRTGWFVESVVSAAIIVLVVRTRRPFYRSRPGKRLLLATVLVVVATLLLPYTPLGTLFGFVRLPLTFYGIVALLVALYVSSAEMAKRFFYRRMG